MVAVIPQIAERVICTGECWYETERCNRESVWLRKWDALILARTTRAGGTCVHKGRATSLTVWRSVDWARRESIRVPLLGRETRQRQYRAGPHTVHTRQMHSPATSTKSRAVSHLGVVESSSMVCNQTGAWGQSERESNAHTMELTQKRQPDVHTLRHGRPSIETLSRRVNDSPRMPSR
jgi:hypothetical protein